MKISLIAVAASTIALLSAAGCSRTDRAANKLAQTGATSTLVIPLETTQVYPLIGPNVEELNFTLPKNEPDGTQYWVQFLPPRNPCVPNSSDDPNTYTGTQGGSIAHCKVSTNGAKDTPFIFTWGIGTHPAPVTQIPMNVVICRQCR
jgi:hypothetical protein